MDGSATESLPTRSEPTTAMKLQRLPWSYGMSAANQVFALFTMFGSVFLLFLDELGLKKEQVGLLLSTFPFCAIIAVLIGPTVGRIGVRRVFITFYTLRTITVGFLILTPWIASSYGKNPAFYFVAAIVVVFALCRAVAETAWYPWVQEFVPNAVRGRFGAINAMVATITGMVALVLANFVLSSSAGLGRFALLIGIGVGFGLIAAVCAVRIPGGAPDHVGDVHAKGERSMLAPLRDGDFCRYLLAMSVLLLGITPLVAFVPLFMKEAVGLSASKVVLLDVAGMLAIMLASIPWGWAADRFGSKPVLLTTTASLAFYPVVLTILPRDPSEFGWAAAAVFVYGWISFGWGIGAGRIMFNTLIPPEKRTAYTAWYYAVIGLASGCGPLLGGWMLQYSESLQVTWFIFHIDAYTPAIVIFLIAVPIALWLFSRLPSHGEMSALSFAGMFFRGDPVGAMQSLYSFNNPGSELHRLTTTERLGQARSLLTVDQLLESLNDPSFNVRFEAVISMARSRAHPKVTQALIAVLKGGEPDLAITAAWALGRRGDRAAASVLREHLENGDALMAARCARALGMLGDQASLSLLLARLRDELDEGLRVAYASALGALGSPAALPELLAFLRQSPREPIRFELALALARIAGKEREIVRLWRQTRQDCDTALSHAMRHLRRQFVKALPRQPDLAKLADQCSTCFAAGELTPGTACMVALLEQLPLSQLPEPAQFVLHEARQRLTDMGSERVEYALVAINVLGASIHHFSAAKAKSARAQPS